VAPNYCALRDGALQRRMRPDLGGEEGTGGLCEGQLCVRAGKPFITAGCQGTSMGLRGITHYPGLSHLLLFTHTNTTTPDLSLPMW